MATRAEYMRQWRQKNAAKRRAYQAAYYRAHRETAKQTSAAWYRQHKPRVQALGKAWRAANRPAFLARCRQWNQENRSLLKRQAMAAYGNQCAHCGFADLRALCIDHVASDGASHRQAIGGGGGRTYRWLRDHGYPAGFQVLCANCNLIKALELGELGRRRAAHA